MKRRPAVPLRPFVQTLWALDGGQFRHVTESSCEYVLPTGAMHIVIRLNSEPLRLFNAGASGTHSIGHAVIGGARAGFYVKSADSFCSVGAQLRPGAARALLGPAACEFSDRHVRLEDFCGSDADDLRARLHVAGSPDQRLDLFESWLLARLDDDRILPSAVAEALTTFADGGTVAEAVARSGYSHRRFIRLFDEAVGLTPKRFCRVLRFRRLLARIARAPGAAWADLALAAGYSDQPHFVREFREFAGITPDAYRRAAPVSRHHVLQPVHGGLAAGSNPFNTGARSLD